MAPVVNVASLARKRRSAPWLPAISEVLDISKIIQFLDNDKSSSISQLIKGKSRALQKLLKYFNGTTSCV